MTSQLKEYLSAAGRRAGSATSKRKARASRANLVKARLALAHKIIAEQNKIKP